MKASPLNDEQMVAILREADRTSVAEAVRKSGIGEQTIYTWRKHFGQVEPADVKGRKALSSENAKLYKLLAERLCRKAGLQLPRRRPRRRLATARPRPLPPRAANQIWACDFVFDACANGRPSKCLTVVDEFTLECLAIDAAGSIRSGRVIDSGKPWQNGTNEPFNGKFHDECRSPEWLRRCGEASVLIEAWRRHYNAVRPHQSLNYLTAIEFKQHHPSQPVLQPRAISRE